MNFTSKEDIKESKIIKSITDKENGSSEAYDKYKEDTNEAKSLIQTDFTQAEFETYDDVTEWFVKNYYMYDSNDKNKPDKEHSFYRAFLSLNNNVVFVLRVANHYATRDSLRRIYKGEDKLKPKFVYHIIIDRIDLTYANPNKVIVDGKKIRTVQNVRNYILKANTEDLKKKGESVGRNKIIKVLTSLFEDGRIKPDGKTVVATNERIMDSERFFLYQRINEELEAYFNRAS